MYLATIDCGTTNTRIFIVKDEGSVVGRASRKVGVRDTAISGSNAVLKDGIRKTFDEALAGASLSAGDIGMVLSSGMITSEIGLIDIPHLWAPAGLKELADNIVEVADPGVVPLPLPIRFIRGIKNRYNPDTAGMRDVGRLDFMRGEETQVAGLLAARRIALPVTVVILSSHTKFIPIDRERRILGSLTTLSGQIFEAVVQQTFIGKSIGEDPSDPAPASIDGDIVEQAYQRVREAGFLRTLLMPRFLDVLLKTRWHQRRLFVEAAIAAEDMRAIGYFARMGFPEESHFILVGNERRCRIYEHLLRHHVQGAREIDCISDPDEVDALSIRGAVSLARMAGMIPR